jgi:hypothetical protein
LQQYISIKAFPETHSHLILDSSSMTKDTNLSKIRKFQNAKRNISGDHHNEKESDPSDSILSSIKIINQQFEKIYSTIKASSYANQLLKTVEFEIELQCMKDFLFKSNKTFLINIPSYLR